MQDGHDYTIFFSRNVSNEVKKDMRNLVYFVVQKIQIVSFFH